MKDVAGAHGRLRVGLDLDRLPPLGRRLVLLPVGIQGEPEVEMDESARGMQRLELPQPLERAIGPGGDRRAHRGLERVRVVAEQRGELRARVLGLTAVVGPFGGAECLRLGVVAEEDAELEGGRLLAGAPVTTTDEGDSGHDGRGDERQTPHHQPNAGARRHAPSVARAAWAAEAKLLYFVKLCRRTESCSSRPSQRSTRWTPPRRKSFSPRTPSQSWTCASATSGTKAIFPARCTCLAATWSPGSSALFRTSRARCCSIAPPEIAPPLPRKPSRSSAMRTSSLSPGASPTGSGTASPTRSPRRSMRRSVAVTAAIF